VTRQQRGGTRQQMGHDETFLGSRYTSQHARWAEKLMFSETWNQSRSFPVRKAAIDGKRVPLSRSLSSPNVWSQCLPSPSPVHPYRLQCPRRDRHGGAGQGGERERKKKDRTPSHCCVQSPLEHFDSSTNDKFAIRAHTTTSLPMSHGHTQKASKGLCSLCQRGRQRERQKGRKAAPARVRCLMRATGR
jgi:hypothetical protein